MIEENNHPSIFERGVDINIFKNDMNIARDSRTKFKEYLENPNKRVPYGTKAQSLNFVLIEGEIYKRGFDELLLKCLSFPDNMKVRKQVHEGVYGAHQYGVKMCQSIRRHDYFWPTILNDGITYSKGCQQCQICGCIQRILVVEFHSIVKSWLFRGWAMNLIGKIHPASSKGHNFILVATNYFTKWVEAVPLKKA